MSVGVISEQTTSRETTIVPVQVAWQRKIGRYQVTLQDGSKVMVALGAFRNLIGQIDPKDKIFAGARISRDDGQPVSLSDLDRRTILNFVWKEAGLDREHSMVHASFPANDRQGLPLAC